jgi:cytochrome c556
MPRTDAEWADVATNAALIVESANLLVDSERALDAKDWPAMARAMAEAASKALDAARKKSPDAILEVGDELNQTCDRCHERYSRN